MWERKHFRSSELFQCLQGKAENQISSQESLPAKMKGRNRPGHQGCSVFQPSGFNCNLLFFGPGQSSYLSGLSEKSKFWSGPWGSHSQGHWVGCFTLCFHPTLLFAPYPRQKMFLRGSQHKCRGPLTWALLYNPFVKILRTEIVTIKGENHGSQRRPMYRMIKIYPRRLQRVKQP